MEVREARFSKGLVCAHCGDGKVRRHGKFKDKSGTKQRHYCRDTAGRPPHKRGEPATKRSLSREQVCVLVARDRQIQTVSEPSCCGSPSVAAVQKVLGPLITEGSILCADGASHYRRFCIANSLTHFDVSAKKRIQGSIYHIQNINAYHSRLRDWIRRFKGVATKYLPNYLTWHLFVDQVAKLSPGAARKRILFEACSVTILRRVAFETVSSGNLPLRDSRPPLWSLTRNRISGGDEMLGAFVGMAVAIAVAIYIALKKKNK